MGVVTTIEIKEVYKGTDYLHSEVTLLTFDAGRSEKPVTSSKKLGIIEERTNGSDEATFVYLATHNKGKKMECLTYEQAISFLLYPFWKD